MVYVFLANGFEEIEALATADILRRAEIPVTTVGVGSKTVTGSHQISVVADLTDAEFVYDGGVEMVVLPGGMPGTLELEKSVCVNSAVDRADSEGKYIAAICAAPSILGHKGLLRGKKACCYPGFEDQLIQATVVNDRVVHDGNIITSRGAGTVYEFAAKLVELLRDKETAEKVLASMICKK